MKRMISAVLSLLTILTILPLAIFSASAETAGENYYNGWDGDVSKSCFVDSTGIFDNDDVTEITNEIQKYAGELNMHIVVFAAGSEYNMSDSAVKSFCDENYDALCGEDTDGVLYFMDFTGKKPAYDYISTSGMAVLRYQSHIQSIINATFKYLPSSGSDYTEHKDDIKSAIYCFLGQLSEYNGKDKYFYDSGSGKYFYYKNGELMISDKKPFVFNFGLLAAAVIVGAIAGLIYYCAVKNTYKFKSSANPSVYVSSEDTRFTRREDRYIRTYTTKTKIESSSGGSRGGHSGGHSGGGHGGGGSHR